MQRVDSYCMQWTKGLPIEVLPFAYKPVKVKLEELGGTADLRMAKNKAVCVHSRCEMCEMCEMCTCLGPSSDG